MTEKEAFEAHMRRAYEDSVARDMAYDMERDTWSAALAWLRSQGEPVAYAHTIHMEFDQTSTRYDALGVSPFGVPGVDYDESYGVTSIPLYAAQPPAIPDGWISIETAPKDELILVGPTKRMGVCAAMNHSRDGWVTETPSGWATIYTPKHWMPLPHAPEPSK